MLTLCPFCRQEMNFSNAQQDKIQKALESLQDGKCLKVGCPHCKKSITLNQRGEILQEEGEAAPSHPNIEIEPPAPPDTSWLGRGEYEEREIVEDIPKVLLLIKDDALRESTEEVFADFGYMALKAESAQGAIDRMRFESFKGVVYHTGFEGVPLEQSVFAQHMNSMTMSERRFIYYVLVGPELNTLYDLEALSLSANLTVNEGDIKHLNLILRKGLTDYEALFGPYLAAMRDFGRK